jgi:hypothetical protein
MASIPYYEKACAMKGLTSYRYPSAYSGWIMIGAHDNADAIREANRSLERKDADLSKLQVWNGSQYAAAYSHLGKQIDVELGRR